MTGEAPLVALAEMLAASKSVSSLSQRWSGAGRFGIGPLPPINRFYVLALTTWSKLS
jgi:hypothetical protein